MNTDTPLLFRPMPLRGVTLPNRLVLAPMMQYRAENGFASDWHLAHYGKFALGGFGTVMTEVVSVESAGRITHGDLGLWSDEFIPGLKRVTDFVHSQGALAAIQIGHSGRKRLKPTRLGRRWTADCIGRCARRSAVDAARSV